MPSPSKPNQAPVRSGQRLAIVGTGIAGMVAARLLHRAHDVTVFEAGDHVGGHTNTIDVQWQGRPFAIDTGFIVYNERNYPNFSRLLAALGVATQPSSMSLSVECARRGIVWNGSSLNGLLARRRNLLRPGFWRLLRDMMRFHRDGAAAVGRLADDVTLGDFLADRNYSQELADLYAVPLGAAIWSAADRDVLSFPAGYYLRFLHNHGMLSYRDRPSWRVVSGGSQRYVERLVAPFRDRIRLRTPVTAIRRDADGVALCAGGEAARFDGVVIAAHSDQALRMLADPTPAERELLGAVPFQTNEAVLHVDHRVLPRPRRAWAAWNHHVPVAASARVSVTYDMNILQGLDAPVEFCVTLNDEGRIAPDAVLRRIDYHHPVITRAGVAAQARKAEIDGARRTWFCGAYWGFGFHEDGVVSALDVAAQFGLDLSEAA